MGTALIPLFKNTGSNGAITLLEANLMSPAVSTALGDLISYSGTDTTGTGTKATICTFATVAVAYTAGSATLLTSVVAANRWIAYQNRLGTTNATYIISLSYVNGR
jgi:thiamine monophosphate kinase